MTAFFITGTGTDVGKTFVAAGLARRLRATGRTVSALKPVVSGFDPEHAEISDPGRLLAALGRPVAAEQIERISPWRFKAPLSPDLAARREGRTIEFDALVAFCRRAIDTDGGTLLIEGVGGVMVPLDESRTVLDWIAALDRPVVVVAGSYLGTLSHTLTCLDALAHRAIPVKVLVVSESPQAAVPLDDTLATLTRFAGPIPIVAVPRLAPGAFDHEAFDRLAALL